MLFASALARACEPFDPAAVPAEAEAVELAYGAHRYEEVRALEQALLARLACATRPLTPPEALRVHEVVGLAARATGADPANRARARQAFAAVRAIDPGWRFPPTVVEDDPAWPEWEDLAAIPVDHEDRDPWRPNAPRVWLDGVERAPSRPTAWSTVVQLGRGDEVLHTSWLAPGEAPPRLPRKVSPALAVPAVALVVGGAALVADGWYLRTRDCVYDDGWACPDATWAGLTYGELHRALAGTGYGMVGVGAGLGGVAILTSGSLRWTTTW